jgi:hypothetical protein
VADPAKVVLDLAVTLALGGDCLADIALLRSAPGVFGPVASAPRSTPRGPRHRRGRGSWLVSTPQTDH